MSDVPLSKRARKKQAQARDAQMSQSGTRSESVGSDTIRKDHPATSTASSPAPEIDGDLKSREGSNPFIEVVQKKVRNLTKRRTRLEALDAQSKDDSMPPLKPDQLEALSHLPQVIAIINELNELVPVFKKLDQSETEILAAQHRKFKDDLREAERAKDVAVKESYDKGVADGRGETKILTSFLKHASFLRERPSSVEGENSAVEQVLIGVYQGGEKGAAVAQKLAEGSSDNVSDEFHFTYADVKQAVLKSDEKGKAEALDSPSEHLNGSFVHVDHSGEHATNGSAGYQVALSETTALDNEHYGKDAPSENVESGRPTGLNFFQQSELEADTYHTSSHGYPVQGISFLQESELGTSQPHEDYPKGEGADQLDNQSNSSLPPIQTFTESEGRPQVNLGAAVFAGAEVSETGEAGNAAAEKILHPTATQHSGKVETKTDWAEEASPTTEIAPVLPEKKKEEEEWTTQASKHSRHQSQQRGRGGPRGGRGEGWRGEGRSGPRGGYRARGGGGERGERGAPNGERRGSWRGGERGRGRGGNVSLPPTAV